MERHTIITYFTAFLVVVFWAVTFLHLRGINLTSSTREQEAIETKAVDLLLCHADSSCTDHSMSVQLKNFLSNQWQCTNQPWNAHFARDMEDSTFGAKRIVALALYYIELYGARELRHEHHSDRHVIEITLYNNASRVVRLHYARRQDDLTLERIEGLCSLLTQTSKVKRQKTDAAVSDFLENQKPRNGKRYVR